VPAASPVVGSDTIGASRASVPEPDLFVAMTQHSRDFHCAFRSDGTIIYVNDRCEEYLGVAPAAVLGTNIAQYVHPDDLERAILAIGVAVEHRPKLAPAAFRIRHAEGRWRRLEVNGSALAPEYPDVVAITGRISHDADLYNAVLELLTAGKPMVEVLAAIPAFTIWRNDDTLCTVTWVDDVTGTRRATGSSIPSLLTGVMAPPEGHSPWLKATATGEEVVHDTLTDLPPSIRAAAEASGLLGVWVLPVADAGGGDPALITLWSAHVSAPVRLSEYPARIATQLVDLIFRWRYQQRQLEHAAGHDGLTGLPHRATFFSTLADNHRSDIGDAVLYIDLDGFKPVNDRYGHGAGDRVLVELAGRLRDAIRPSDLPARLGGDEFAVLLRCCRTDEAQAIAHRIRERLGEPITLDETPIPGRPPTVTLSASIGVALGASGEALLEAADRAQLEAKRGGGNRVRWAGLPEA
jgi:diguanylate cyclase (GGDEF)-like protein/PAS domain S-box-containing protein